MAKVIVVEDQNLLRQFLVDSLEEAGHEVRSTAHGHEAIDLGYLFYADVLVTDWDLGEEYDGLEVVEACRYANENILAIVISGYLDVLDKANTNKNVFRTLAKPFPAKRLLDYVNEATAIAETSA